MDTKFRNQYASIFKLHGYSLRSDASSLLVEALKSTEEYKRKPWIQKIISNLQTQPLTSSLIDKDILETSIKETTESSDDDRTGIFNVIDAFKIPAYTFDKERKKFVLKSSLGLSSPCLHGDADAKTDIYVERFKVIHQRTMRHRLFSTHSTIASSNKEQNFNIKPVQYLLGTSAKQGNIIVLGMLTQLKEGKFFIEDPTGVVQLNLSQASYKGGLFTENSYVLAEGWYEDSIFHVTAIGFPPPESAKASMQHFGNINFFGGQFSTTVKSSVKLKSLDEKNPDSMFIFLADIWLDHMRVMQKLRTLFAGYSEMPPTGFVFMGNFISSPHGLSRGKIFQDCFKNLGDLIAEFPSLVHNSNFVFVPGPLDPGLGYVFPRPRIPEALVTDFMKKVPKAIFTSNPCHIQYCNQEIVVFREDLMSKMCRNCVYMPWEHEERVDLPNMFARTLVANCHLCPLPLIVSPIYWQFDHSLWLYPLPDMVVVGDKYDPYCTTNTDCIFMNPGSFPRCDFSFKVYFPSSRQVEDSQIADEAS